MSKWTTTLSPEQIEAGYQLTKSLDPRFARDERKFWESRTSNQLHVLAHQAWLCNDADSYQRAKTYLALKTESVQ